MSLLGSAFGAAGAAKGAGPATSGGGDTFFGSMLSNFDSSNWVVNFGPGNASAVAGAKSSPVLDNAPMLASNGGAIIPQNTPGLNLSGGTGAPVAALSATVAGFPVMYMLAGAALLILLWKKA